LHDIASGENKRLTENDKAWDKHPSFSPDGSQIVFWSNRESAVRKQIWIVNLNGSGAHNISQNDYNDTDPIWVK
jgi:Tol biopolymer transport system component